MKYPIFSLLISIVSIICSNNLPPDKPDVTIKNGSSNPNLNKTYVNNDQRMFDEMYDTVHRKWIKRSPNDKNGKILESTDNNITAHNGKESTDAIDGYWSSWGKCYCIEGVGRSVRNCTNPVPRNGGKICQGTSLKTENCCPKRKPVIKCIENKTLNGKCMCGNVQCDNKFTCVNGTCLQAHDPRFNLELVLPLNKFQCIENKKINGKCMCGNVQCDKKETCVNGTCLQECPINQKIEVLGNCICYGLKCETAETCVDGLCLHDCVMDITIMGKCMCDNVQCGDGKMCIDGKCLEAPTPAPKTTPAPDCKHKTKNPNGQTCKCERMTCNSDQICYEGSCIEENDCFYLWVSEAANQKDCRCSLLCKLYGLFHLVYKDLSRQLDNIKEGNTINFYMAVALICLVAVFVLITLIYTISKLINCISKSRYNQDIKQIFTDK